MQGTGAQLDPYLVATAEDFDSIRTLLSGTIKYFKQVADIDLGEFNDWKSLSESANNKIDYNGQGFQLNNVTANTISPQYHGIFGKFYVHEQSDIYNVKVNNISIISSSNIHAYLFSNGAVIKDVHITNARVESNGSVSTCNVLASKVLKNIHVEGELISNSMYAYQVSGICNLAGTVDNCTFSGSLKGNGKVAGIGFALGDVKNCKVSANLRGVDVGGISYYEGTGTHSVYNCEFEGEIYGSNAAGILCSNHASTSTFYTNLVVKNCISRGVVDGSSAAGIVWGRKPNRGTINVSVENCISEANLYGSTAYGILYVAGSIGLVKNSYALMDKIVRSSGSGENFGRIGVGTLENNYALDTMQFYEVDDRV